MDLKGAYDTVPRDKLMEVVGGKLEQPLHGMISLTLQPLQIVTKGDKTKTRKEMTREVPQGSPLSPTLFNLYMGTLWRSLERKKYLGKTLD